MSRVQCERLILLFLVVTASVLSCIHIDSVCSQPRECQIATENDFIAEVEQSVAEQENKVSLGEFTITHYAIDERCCGKTDGVTSTGTKAEVGRTIAVDPEVIPYGTKVEIDGITYIAEDCGGAVKGNHIDILVASYDEAVSRGKITREVFLKGETNEN